MRWIAIFFLLSGMASAGPLTWSLVNTTFNDGGTASGSFVFDADTNAISNWNVLTTGGSVLGPFVYLPGNSSSGIFSGVFEFWSNQAFADCCGFLQHRYLMLSFVDPLTNAGGSVALTPGAFGQWGGDECLNCNPYRLITTGSVAAAVTLVPEPVCWRFLVLGCALLLAARHRLSAAV